MVPVVVVVMVTVIVVVRSVAVVLVLVHQTGELILHLRGSVDDVVSLTDLLATSSVIL